MRREDVAPTIAPGTMPGGDSEKFEHDAFATIRLSTTYGGGGTLFGSDLNHSEQVSISIQRASLTRSLSNDWIYGDSLPIVEINMTQAQFAQFITSQGRSEGTPCTLRTAPERGTRPQMMPGIKPVEKNVDTLKREIRDETRRRMEEMQKSIDRLGELIESGKTPKTDLRAIHRDLARHAGQLPGSLTYIVKQAEEATENTVAAGKMEVEAYITNAAQRIGLKAIAEGGPQLLQAPQSLT